MKKKFKKKNIIFLLLFLFLIILSYFLYNNIKQKNHQISVLEDAETIHKTNIIKIIREMSTL